MVRSLRQRLDLPDWIHSEHSIHGVTALAVGAPVKIHLYQGDQPELLVVGPGAEDISPIIIAGVGSTLYVMLEPDFSCGNTDGAVGRGAAITVSPVVVGIVLPKLKSVSVTGSAVVDLFAVEQPELDLFVSGTGQIKASGGADKLQCKVAGAGCIDTEHFAARAADLTIDGEGSICCSAYLSVSAYLNGDGKAQIYGDPLDRNVLVDGPGEVTFFD